MDEEIDRRFTKVEAEIEKIRDRLTPFQIEMAEKLTRMESSINSLHTTVNNLTLAVTTLSNKPIVESENVKKEKSTIKVGIIVGVIVSIVTFLTGLASQILPNLFK